MTPVRPFKGPSIKPPKGPSFASGPATYRDPAPPPVEVAFPPPPERPDAGARLVVLAGVLGFLIGYALAVMS